MKSLLAVLFIFTSIVTSFAQQEELKPEDNSNKGLKLENNYHKFIEDYKNGFQNKAFAHFKSYLSSDYAILQHKGKIVDQIIQSILTQYPKLISVDIDIVKDSILKVNYDFENIGKSTSNILLSEDGKIKKIEFFDNIIAESLKKNPPRAPQQIDEELAKKDKSTTIQFPSLDGLMVSAKLYEIDKTSPIIVLCHQARYNKFEYNAIAVQLNERGFNCIAIDQRSGGEMKSANGDVFQNETFLQAEKEGKPTEYLDAEQDIVAAIKYAKNRYNSPLILWGSSYSSTLALYVAIENDAVDAVVSFSPGDYAAEAKGSLIDKLPNLKKPAFITSSKQEAVYINKLLEKSTLNEDQVYFKPEGNGYHGSRALWPNQTGGEEYWIAIDKFLKKTFANKKYK